MGANRWRVVVEIEDTGTASVSGPCGQAGTKANVTQPGGKGPPTLRPGVVEVHKNNNLIGFASPDPLLEDNVAHWVLDDLNSYPVNLGGLGGELMIRQLTLQSESADQLCQRARNANLSNPRTWRVFYQVVDAGPCALPE